MKSVVLTIIKEFKLIFRDGITLYMAISPALLALVFILVFGSVRESSMTLAVDRSVPEEIASKLAQVAEIERVENYEELVRRIEAADSVAGVYTQDGTVTVLTEGNEPQGFAESQSALVNAAIQAGALSYKAEAVDPKPSLAFQLSMTTLLLLALFIGGASLGLSGVSERESGVIRAIAVSPMTLLKFSLSKTIPALLLGMIGVSAAALIIGRADAISELILLAVSSVLVSGMIIFLIMVFADNLIAAVGVLKIIMPVSLVVGIASSFVPDQWLPIFYVFPMYWQYSAIESIILNKEALFQSLMILVTSLPWFIAVMLVFTKKVKIRA